MNTTFQQVGALYPKRSAFDLSYSKLFDCDMGQLIPVMCDEVVPGDHFTISNEIVLRMQPMLAPILSEINITTHYFFVPYRILWDNFEDFITGGVDGNFEGSPPTLLDFMEKFPSEKGSILDYFGFPIGANITMTPDNAPSSFPVSAYNKIYNEFYRDQNLIEEIDEQNTEVLYRAWDKDYFTSALPWVQRGTVPALPVNTFIDGSFVTNINTSVSASTGIGANGTFTLGGKNFRTQSGAWGTTTSGDAQNVQYSGGLYASTSVNAQSTANTDAELVALSTAFNVADLRLAFQISRWQERNARAGSRYTEFLHAHFGVFPRDDRLQRPEYIGGSKSPVIISEVLQTSSTDETSPQGNMAGHGISVDRMFVGKYFVKEFGLIMGLMSITPKPSYNPQGVHRQWLRRTRFDYYFREFANLSEQAITNAEIYVQGNEQDRKVFGFQGRFDELRVKNNMVANNMRDIFDYWHPSRKFDDQPLLNQSFIECKPSKRIFAVQNEPGLIIHYANKIKAIRPMPVIGEPGMVDHF